MTPNFYAGAGIAVNYFFYNADKPFFPVLADFRVSLPMHNKTYLFFNGKIGYALDLVSCTEGGVYMSPAVGLGIGKLYISAGYVAQYVHVYDSSTISEYDINLGAVSFRVGMKF